MSRRHGLTLVELLIAIALVLAIGALVMPSLFGLVAQGRLDAAADQVRSAMILSRARAQRDAVPVRLVARRGESGQTELFAIPLGEPAGRDAKRSEAPAPVLDGAPEGAEAAPAVIGGRPLCVLPDGVRVEEQAPAEAGAEAGVGKPQAENAGAGRRSLAGASGSSRSGSSAGASGSSSQQIAGPLTMAVFLPDGTAAGSARFLVDSHGRAMQVTVSRWTGLAKFEASVAPTEAHADEEMPPPAGPAEEAGEEGGRR